MPREIEGVLTAKHRSTLEIEDFIFHIISNEDTEDNVVYLDGVELQPSQEQFFLDRLKDVASGTQYIFKDDSANLRQKVQQLSGGEDFISISRQITFDFAERHSKNMSEGVFIISRLKYVCDGDTTSYLLFLVKMDKQPSLKYSYKEKNGKKIAVVEEIQDSLNENKAAIQKSALVDISGYFSWDVLAFDRSERQGLTDYFKAFLGVKERQVDSEWTKLAHRTVRKWARSIPKDDFPEGEDAASFSGRSYNFLCDNDVFDTESYINTVVRSSNPEKKERLISTLKQHLEEAGVAGQRFSPQPNSIPGKDKKEKYLTAEGVVVIFEGDREAAGISIDDIGRGRKRITIETSDLNIS